MAILPSAWADERQTVTILADDAYPPYTFVENGQLKGIYIDLLQLASKRLSHQYDIKFQATPWQRGLNELKDGRAFALIPPYKHYDTRPYMKPYSVPLLTETVIMLCHQDVDISGYIGQELNSLAKPIKVGVNAGYLILNEALSKARKKGTLAFEENKDTSSNVLKLLLRRIDCYLNDRISTYWEIKQLSTLFPDKKFEQVKLVESLEVMTQTAHIGYTDAPNNTYEYKGNFVIQMDKAIEDIVSSKEYAQILSSYALPATD